jgi:LysM repeat protein
MTRWIRLVALGTASSLLAAGCAGGGLPALPATRTPGLLALPATATPLASPAASRGPQPTPVIIASPTPTATPVTHVVAEGESLLSIALDYGVSLAALQAANPDVQVRFLSIGAVLIIPPPEGGAAISATQLAAPPPQPLDLRGPACYPTATEGLYCLVEVSNPLDAPVENVSARVTLAGSDGLPVAQAVGFSAVELLSGRSAAPLLVTFQPVPAVPIAASAVELLTADPAAASLAAGRAVLLEVVEHTGQAHGTRLTVSGQVRNASGQAAGSAWVVVTGYDATDAIVGFRVAPLPGGLAAQAAQSFALVVDSLGGPVERYAIVAEGRP